MPDGVGYDETAGDHMHYYPKGLEGQGYASFPQREDGHPRSINIIGAHEMPGGPGPDAFKTVQWNCSSSVLPLRA
jgi:hypothetical protein